MSFRRAFAFLPAAVAVGAAALILAACGDDAHPGTDATPAPATSSTPAASADPVGLIAIGHSALTGYNSDPANPDVDVPANSWATGDNPDVNSIYRRMTALRPETEGHVWNAAVSGATSNALVTQAKRALQKVPHPALVIVQIVGNEIRCDGDDAAHAQVFGENVAAALDVIVEASPESRILIVGFVDHPTEALAQLIADTRPEYVTEFLTGTGLCDPFDPAGVIQPDKIAAFTAIVEQFEAAEAEACAAWPQCSTDGGLAAAFVDTPEDWSSDIIHYNAHGLSRIAETLWPAVERLLTSE